MTEPAEGYMADVSADLCRIWLEEQIPDPERLECFYRIAVEAGNLINDTMGKMRRAGVPEDEISRICLAMSPPRKKRRRK